MSASVYFEDVTSNFITHYVELMKEDPSKTEPMYSPKVKLVIDDQTFEGNTVFEQIKGLGKLELATDSKYHGQPYETSSVIISAKMVANKKPYSVAFILEEVNPEDHQFGITFQIMKQIRD